MKQLFLFLFLLCAFIVRGTTYYLSETGNDANDGLSTATPWKTISKINTTKVADNSTFLFKCGETFRGSVIIAPGSGINMTFGSYGTGAKPKIKGSVALTGWTVTTDARIPSGIRSKVYETTVTMPPGPNVTSPNVASGPQYLYMDEELQTICRYPNADSPYAPQWLEVDNQGATGSKSLLIDNDLPTKADGYWVGATLKIRPWSWYLDAVTISAYSEANKQITTKYDLHWEIIKGWGYFLENKIQELDYPGEYYYDSSNSKIYFYPKNNVNPNAHLVEIMAYTRGVEYTSDLSGRCLIENLEIRQYTGEGIHVNRAPNSEVRNNDIYDCFIGFYTTAGPSTTGPIIHAHHNLIKNCYRTGISTDGAGDATTPGNNLIEKNKILDHALAVNYGRFNLGAMTYTYTGDGIYVAGKGYNIKNNWLERISWNGIYTKAPSITATRPLYNGYHTIENNVVKKALWVLNDGGGISLSSGGNLIKGNLILETVGNTDISNGNSNMTSNTDMPNFGMGIGADGGFDQKTNTLLWNDNVIQDNGIANNNSVGLRYNTFDHTEATGNTLYNNGETQLRLDFYEATKRNNHTIKNNIYVPLAYDQTAVIYGTEYDSGDIDNNYFYTPLGTPIIQISKNYDLPDPDGTPAFSLERYSLAEYTTKYPTNDMNSTQVDKPFANKVTAEGSNMYTNSGFDTNLTDWSTNAWQSYDAGRMKISQPVGGGNALFSYKKISHTFTAGQYYRLRFDIQGQSAGDVIVQVKNMTTNKIIEEYEFSYGATLKTQELIFTTNQDQTNTKILFYTNSQDTYPYWVDNITLQTVTPDFSELKQKVMFVYNDNENWTGLNKTVSLNNKIYKDVYGNSYSGTVTLAPYESKVLIYEKDLLVTAVETMDGSFPDVKIYPNPAKNRLVVDCESMKGAKIEIYNTIGKKMLEKLNQTGLNEVDITNCEKGILLLKITQGDKTGIYKILKQ